MYGSARLWALLLMLVGNSISASNHLPSGGSLASGLLISRTQTQILRHDDQADTSCIERRFTGAELVGTMAEAVGEAGNIVERKWQEQWTLERCGREVGYRVFFTDLGDGGAYFAFTPTN